MANLPLTGREPVDQLLEDFPQAGRWLSDHDVICTQCGETYWGPLQELAELRGIKGGEFETLLKGLNEFLAA
jgi:hypothetical protein